MITGISEHWGPHHGPQSAMLLGIAGSVEGSPSAHYSTVENTCVGCHVGEGANHSFEPNVAACQACHADAENFDINGLQTDVQAQLDTIGEQPGWSPDRHGSPRRRCYCAVQLDLHRPRRQEHGCSQPWLYPGLARCFVRSARNYSLIPLRFKERWKDRQGCLVGSPVSLKETPPSSYRIRDKMHFAWGKSPTRIWAGYPISIGHLCVRIIHAIAIRFVAGFDRGSNPRT